MNRKQKFPFLDYYMLLSLVASIALWGICYYFSGKNLGKTTFSAFFVLLNYIVVAKVYGFSEYYKKSGKLNIYYIAQSVILILLSFQVDIPGHLYISFLPIMFGISILYRDNFINKGLLYPKAIAMLVIFLIVHKTADSLWFNSLGNIDYVLFVTYSLWSCGIAYLLGHLSVTERKNYLNKLRSDGNENGERMFYHDFSNFTHGLLLFLNQKKDAGQTVSEMENKLLIKEVESLQVLVSDYFNKTAPLEFDYVVDFSSLKGLIQKTVNNYLPKERYNCKIVYIGKPSVVSIYYPYFNRIFINLIKNIADHGKSDDCEIIFCCKHDELKLVVKNKIFNINNSTDLASDLKSKIMSFEGNDDISTSEGIGLESISSLANYHDGHFRFWIEDGYWISEVILGTDFDQNYNHGDIGKKSA